MKPDLVKRLLAARPPEHSTFCMNEVGRGCNCDMQAQENRLMVLLSEAADALSSPSYVSHEGEAMQFLREIHADRGCRLPGEKWDKLWRLIGLKDSRDISRDAEKR